MFEWLIGPKPNPFKDSALDWRPKPAESQSFGQVSFLYRKEMSALLSVNKILGTK